MGGYKLSEVIPSLLTHNYRSRSEELPNLAKMATDMDKYYKA
jgi:hypothetical protein